MSREFTYENAEFDEYAANYDAALGRGLAVSGEDKNYFARGRIVWLAHRLAELGNCPRQVMDFGCGIGSSAPYLLEYLDAERVTGVDVSEKSLAVAAQLNGTAQTRFLSFADYQPNAEMDLVFCNGVFHHIPIADRAAAVAYVYRALKPGGLFAMWDNNSWNPGARWVMSRIPFDRDAVMIGAGKARRLLRAGGFELLGTDFLFIFPRALRWLRFLEPHLARLPVGAQYQMLGRKPLS